MAKPGPKPAPKRVRRTPEAARQTILDAAVRVFSKVGPDAAGLKQVAAEAGVSHALVVHYFGSYDALVEATVLEATAKIRARMLDRIQSLANPSAEALLLSYFDTALEPWYGRLVSWEFLRGEANLHEHAQQIAPDMRLIADVTQQLLAGHTQPAPSREETEVLIVAVWSMTVGYVAGREFFWRALGHTPGPERDRALRDSLAQVARTLFGETAPLAPLATPEAAKKARARPARARPRPRSR